jgi:hypothetical protein
LYHPKIISNMINLGKNPIGEWLNEMKSSIDTKNDE